MVRLTIMLTPPHCGQLLCDFFGELLTIYYDNLCSKMDFRQEKSFFFYSLQIKDN